MGCCCSCSRTLVSKKKKRYVEARTADNAEHCPAAGVDLDLIFLGGSIVCMGFPASGIEAWYRNPYEQVLEFLDMRLGSRYKVYNLCIEPQHRYDREAYFHGRTGFFPFRDHHPCPLALIPAFVADARRWIANPRTAAGNTTSSSSSSRGGGGGDGGANRRNHRENGSELGSCGGDGRNNTRPPPPPPPAAAAGGGGGDGGVVVLHCKAGKGRTGLLAICLLMAMDPKFSDPDEAIAHYGRERTHDGKGLTHRSQIRYVHYFSQLLRSSGAQMPSLIPMLQLRRLEFVGMGAELDRVAYVSIECLLPAAVAREEFADFERVATDAGAKKEKAKDRQTHRNHSCEPTTTDVEAETERGSSGGAGLNVACQDAFGAPVVFNVYWNGSCDGTPPGAREVVVHTDGEGSDEVIALDFSNLLRTLPSSSSSHLSLPAQSLPEPQLLPMARFLSQLRGDLRFSFMTAGGAVVGALSLHTLFAKPHYHWSELDKLYKSKKLASTAAVRLVYAEVGSVELGH